MQKIFLHIFFLFYIQFILWRMIRYKTLKYIFLFLFMFFFLAIEGEFLFHILFLLYFS